MGCLIDTFVIMPNRNNPVIIYSDGEYTKEEVEKLVKKVHKKYRSMFKVLINEFLNTKNYFSMNELISPSKEDWVTINELTDFNDEFDCDFDDRYRGNCLRQKLKDIFYDTLLIIETDYDENKINRYIVVNQGTKVSKRNWLLSRY